MSLNIVLTLRRTIEEQLAKHAASLATPTLTVDLLKDLKPARIKLLRCDDESCEYEDLIDGAIKGPRLIIEVGVFCDPLLQ